MLLVLLLVTMCMHNQEISAWREILLQQQYWFSVSSKHAYLLVPAPCQEHPVMHPRYTKEVDREAVKL